MSRIWPIVCLLVAALAVDTAGASPPEFATARGLEVPDELLVGFHAGVADAQAYERHGGVRLGQIGTLPIHRVRVPAGALEAVEAALAGHPDVRFVERNRLHPITAAVSANDPQFEHAWHLQRISAPLAWALTVGKPEVVIAIIDTGVEGTHPDLASKMVPGYNFYSNNTNTADVHGHGTRVAGVAAAIGNNLLGVTGVSWKSRIMPIRVTNSSGYATTSDIADGINYAVAHGARVINMSLDGVVGSTTIRNAAQYANSRGVVVVAGAGNCSCVESYADTPYIISVSALDQSDQIAPFSSRGNYVDVSAPGWYIWTTTLNGGYVTMGGTSMASPQVSGVAALMLSANPGLAASQVESLIQANADNLGPSGWDQSYGWGRVNAYRAVLAAVGSLPADSTNPTVSISAPSAGAVVSGTVTVSVSASDNVGVSRVELYVDGALYATDVLAPYAFSWNTSGLVNGNHTLTARAVDLAGNVGTSSARTVDVENGSGTGQIIIDNAAAGVQNAAGGRTFTGTWCTSAGSGPYGASSLYSCGSGGDTYRFTPTIPTTRSYDVYVRWTTYSTRGGAVPIKVRHAGGDTTRTYNEKLGGSQWVLHGRYTFNAGTGGWVETSDAGGQANADAVKFVPVP